MIYFVYFGWVRFNFGGGGNVLMKVVMIIIKLIFVVLNFSDSSWELV